MGKTYPAKTRRTTGYLKYYTKNDIELYAYSDVLNVYQISCTMLSCLNLYILVSKISFHKHSPSNSLRNCCEKLPQLTSIKLQDDATNSARFHLGPWASSKVKLPVIQPTREINPMTDRCDESQSDYATHFFPYVIQKSTI